MGLGAKEGEKTQRPIPPMGQTLGMCVSIIDLGTHMDLKFQKEKKLVYIAWELPKHRAVFDPAKGEQAMLISQEYALFLGEKANFRKMIDSWTGKKVTELDAARFKKLLGKPAMIQVTHAESGGIKYANIATSGIAVFQKPAEVLAPATTENPLLFFDLDSYSDEVFAKIPKYLQEKIVKSPEYKKIKGGAPAGNAIVDAQGADFNAAEEDF